MSTSTAIGRVSESLRSLLLREMALSLDVGVTILGPDESGQAPRINLFLYKVQEHAFLRNQDWQIKPGASNRLLPPPLSLNLYYLMTPYADNDANLGNATAHEILGEAMRVFYEHAVVPDEYLAGDLDEAREEIRITQNGLDMEELSQVWCTFSEPFRLSVLYEVSVVQLDQSPTRERSLPRRVRQIGRPDVEAPYQPPVVHRIEPTSGRPSSSVTLYGENLTGWKVYVTIKGQLIVDGADLTEDRLKFPVRGKGGPGFHGLKGPLEGGFHELRIDISHLYRRTFFFEVIRR